ncbi:riboflavin biosynthesis protein RibD domain-containing protein [Microthyrium microscopicum]|uniref:2,5-diamino-6-ribosylamino-4(3H)-pyrimidinone 5'-phosphate reductase n=1 Tax=Microthyrium microscopicum TaxID=703497 RepID=A0A6A6U0Q0_9PEZI|nr:riboflavin biosynthesis protein RibD domain-containing protein [Microthyrium microscopicum]
MGTVRETIDFPQDQRAFLQPYLPTEQNSSSPRPFVTLTYAASLDSQIASAPGARTALSGPESKAMTHYLRFKHDAILIGVGTAVADDPALNCRLGDIQSVDEQPRPIILDPSGRWKFSADSHVIRLAKEGLGKAPFVLTRATQPPAEMVALLSEIGGKFIKISGTVLERGFTWEKVFNALEHEGIKSVMIEGGGRVINSLLKPENKALVDCVIVTIAPTWLGTGGVVVSPDRQFHNGQVLPAPRLRDTIWHPLGEDVVLCGRLASQSKS